MTTLHDAGNAVRGDKIQLEPGRLRGGQRKWTVGTRFARLVILAIKGRDWLCRCDCGVTKTFGDSNVSSGKTTSCGCRLREVVTTHGISATPTYNSWKSMVDRCTNEKSKAYERYGGRGITVCDRWTKLENFVSDMGSRPAGTTLDRIDNSLGYSKANCRWASRDQQSNNRTTCRYFTHQGETLSIAQWARRAGLQGITLRKRLAGGWSFEKAITTPIDSRYSAIERRKAG